MIYVPTGYSNLHNTKHKHPPPLPSPDEKKGYFDVHLPEKAFPFYTYIPEVGTYPRKKSRNCFYNQVFCLAGRGICKKNKKKEGMEGIQAGRLKLEGTGTVTSYSTGTGTL